MNRRYLPDLHDPILIEMNRKWRRTDQEIAWEMGFSPRTIWTQRQRLGLPIVVRPLPPRFTPEKESPLPPDKINPVLASMQLLGRRLVEKPSGFWLDGRPASTADVVKAANRIRKAEGRPELGPPHWRAP